MAATDVACGLMKAPVPAGSAHQWRAIKMAVEAQALLSAM